MRTARLLEYPARVPRFQVSAAIAGSRDEVRVPLAAEELEAEKRERRAGEVRVHKEVVTENREIAVPVTREEVHVERVPVEGAPPPREAAFQEGTVAVPVREEEVEIRKRPVVKEEVRISRSRAGGAPRRGRGPPRGGAARRATRVGPGDEQRESVRGDEQRESLRGDEQRESLRGGEPRESLRGDEQRESLRGDEPRESLRGDEPRESLRGDEPRESLRRESQNEVERSLEGSEPPLPRTDEPER